MAPLTTTKTKPTKIEQLAAAAIAAADVKVPEYRRAIEKLERELKSRLNALEQRRGELLTGLASLVRAHDLDRRAQALLDDDAVPKPASERERTLRLDLASLEDELVVTERAVTLQRSAVAQLRGRWSLAVCEAVRGEYRRQAAAVAGALRALDAALGDHRQLGEALHDADVGWTGALWPLLWPGAADLRLDEESTTAARWFREARANDAIAD